MHEGPKNAAKVDAIADYLWLRPPTEVDAFDVVVAPVCLNLLVLLRPRQREAGWRRKALTVGLGRLVLGLRPRHFLRRA